MLLYKTYLFITREKIAPRWNDDFELPHSSYSVSNIQDYIEYIIKNLKHSEQFLLFMFTSIELIIN